MSFMVNQKLEGSSDNKLTEKECDELISLHYLIKNCAGDAFFNADHVYKKWYISDEIHEIRINSLQIVAACGRVIELLKKRHPGKYNIKNTDDHINNDKRKKHNENKVGAI